MGFYPAVYLNMLISSRQSEYYPRFKQLSFVRANLDTFLHQRAVTTPLTIWLTSTWYKIVCYTLWRICKEHHILFFTDLIIQPDVYVIYMTNALYFSLISRESVESGISLLWFCNMYYYYRNRQIQSSILTANSRRSETYYRNDERVICYKCETIHSY